MRRLFLFPAALATVVATSPGVAQATSTTCSTSTVCAEYINTYTGNYPVSGGVAIHGEANGGIGVRGTSVSNVGFYGASGSGFVLSPGVEGESSNQNGIDAGGGFGLSFYNGNAAPHFGAVAYGSTVGFAGYTVNAGTSSSAGGYGVEGFDNVGMATFPISSGDFNAGVFGDSHFGSAVLAEASGTPEAFGSFGKSPVGVYSVADTANGTPLNNAYAFVGESDDVGLSLLNTVTSYSLLADTPTYYLYGHGTASGSGSFYVSTSGNASFSGTVTTSKGTYVRTTGSSGAAMREYGARSTEPNVEDFGEAQLSNGAAFVPIDGRFGDAIDRRTSYLVFVTPEGDCNQLYVTRKSAAGFEVREAHGGRSSLAFQYRIVAKPVDENGTRLAAMPAETPPKDAAFNLVAKSERIAAPLSIEESLKRRLGPQGYAKAIAALRARLAGR